MKTKHKIFYESPASEVVEMKMQGVLCDSPMASSGLWLTTMSVTYEDEDWQL